MKNKILWGVAGLLTAFLAFTIYVLSITPTSSSYSSSAGPNCEWKVERHEQALEVINCFDARDGSYFGHLTPTNAEMDAWNAHYTYVRHWSFGDETKQDYSSFKDVPTAKAFMEQKLAQFDKEMKR